MIGDFKTGNQAWMKKTTMNGYTWLSVYRRAYSYEEGLHVAPEREPQAYGNGNNVKWTVLCVNVG